MKPKEMVHRPFPFANRIGRTQRFRDIGLGGGNSLARRLAGNQPAQQGAGEGATCSVGRVGDDLFARQPELLPRGGEQKIVRPVEVTAGDHYVQLMVAQPR